MRPLSKLLKEKLSEKELELVPRSYDVIGSGDKSVVVIEMPPELKTKSKMIAEAIMKTNKNVRSVLNKISGRKGTYRLDELELIAGDENTEVVHREHGYLLKLDPQKVFFSPREATERQRIASQVKAGENILVMFSGIMPYGICIARKQSQVNKIYGVEINPDAHRYAQENVRINKLGHKIVLINGDVKDVARKLNIKFDSIVMPIAVGGEKFLDEAFKLVKENGTIHFYSTGKGENIFTDAEKAVINAALNNRKKIRIENKIKVLPFASRIYKICLDIRAGVA